MIDSSILDLSAHRLSKAKELLEQANILLQNGRYDGSINRSYYAIFNAVRALLAFISVDSQKHRGVISYFDRYFIKTGILEKHFSQILHTAFEARQTSDYEEFYMPSEEQARQQFENAEKFIQEIEKKRKLIIQEKISLTLPTE